MINRLSLIISISISVVAFSGCRKATTIVGNDSQAISACVTVSTLNGSGTGFFVTIDGSTRILTCRHVIEGAELIVVKDVNGRKYPVTAIWADNKRDVAVIDVDFAETPPLYVFNIEQNITTIPIGENLSCYGDSEGIGVFVKCIGKMQGIGSDAIEVDTPFVQGNSGGPIVLQSSFSVIGVASFLTNINDGNRWVKGTRFENGLRHFAVRVDNVNLSLLERMTSERVTEGDTRAVNALAERAIEAGDIKKAIDLYCYSAGIGDGVAMNALAEVLMGTVTNSIDATRVVELFKKSADAKCVDGIANLGFCYLYGIGVDIDKEKAISLFMEAETNGLAYATYMLGVCYRDGQGVERNLKKAARKFESAVEKGEKHAQNELGVFCLDGTVVGKDDRRAFELFAASAEQGYSEALRNVGEAYANGFWVKTNSVEALKWMKRAAVKGNVYAQRTLGRYFADGFGTTKDYDQAMLWLQKAVNNGSVMAMVDVGHVLYKRGDYYQSAVWFKKGAESGDPTAACFLADLYQDGKGVDKDYAKAYYWFEYARVHSCLFEESWISDELKQKMNTKGKKLVDELEVYLCLDAGRECFVQKKYSEAHYWSCIGRNLGDKECANRAGCAATWLGDWQKAVDHFRFASSGDDPYPWSMYYLADCYLNGCGVEKDVTKAKYWFEKALKAGIKDSEKKILQCAGGVSVRHY